tara:strand:- start:400 stop:531 length:132 start_codon:yes stop_codon:yes gene_type:complete
MDSFAFIAILTIVFLLILLGEQIKLKKEVRKLKRIIDHLKKQK